MAENKKSFILYTELIHTVRKLSKQKAGELFMTILSYVNDENPTVIDPMVDLVWEPIKHNLKRDLGRWEKFKEKQAENGKLGGRPPKEKTQTNPNNPGLLEETQKSLNVNANVNANVIHPRQKIIEALATASYGTPLQELELMADEIIKEYAGKKIGNIQALCNKWVENQRDAVMIPNQDKSNYSFI